MHKEIKRIRLNDDYTIDIVFDDGKAKRFDMKKFIDDSHPKAFIRELLDKSIFLHPKEVDSSFISWSWKSDICWDLLYHKGIDIESFGDGIEAEVPYVENKMKMNRARFNDDFKIDVVFEEGEARRFDMLKVIKEHSVWGKEENWLKVFKTPDTFTHRLISWSNGDWYYGEFIYEDGIEIPMFEGGIEREY